jgi:hypothetical protein
VRRRGRSITSDAAVCPCSGATHSHVSRSRFASFRIGIASFVHRGRFDDADDAASRVSESLNRPQMHDDRRKNALRLLLCELQCSINCVHVRCCLQTFCLALTVASPARRATLVLDTDLLLIKSAVRILPPRKKIIASIFARREAGKRGFMREGFVPRAWMARADMDGSGVLVCLTHEGDCHGKEKSEKEIR